MNVSSVNNNFRANNNKANNVAFTGAATTKVAKYFEKHTFVGEGASVAYDFVGKALVAPLFIMFNPISKEPKDKKQYAALKNPVAGLIQLSMEAPIFLLGRKHILKSAAAGKYGEKYMVSLAKAADKAVVESKVEILASRCCFLASLLLTPVMCSLENYIHPKLMKSINFHKENNAAKSALATTEKSAEVKS